MTIAKEFQRRCDEFPQDAANRVEFDLVMLEEVYSASTEFHVVHDDKTIGAFVFKDGSAFTIVNCKGLHFAILDGKELRAIRKAPHFTEKDVQDLALCEEAERVGRGPNEVSNSNTGAGVDQSTVSPEPKDL
jgi:hypothetical protein